MISPQQVYLVTGFTDMRKSINGLSIIVAEQLELDPLNQAWYVFCNKQRDKLKILFWDTNGFWLYYRRLEQGRFNGRKTVVHWPLWVLNNASCNGYSQDYLLVIRHDITHYQAYLSCALEDHFLGLEGSFYCVILVILWDK
ncbi:IS66 family insertion sequence element accessory protein TnpB [Pseudoalteromonas sp. NBT06-2]|uniref:IS66 family insertion sequence element accessory protein TnpB n=1 Tax=Pseudoalteromonas sp. NBT06-2 TaxID=2025950 RepID=UPI00114108E4|nr:IS66 family insertion sequence element accessory protein TnpB [Pseudoalteromonas sp. NBT06-2]